MKYHTLLFLTEKSLTCGTVIEVQIQVRNFQGIGIFLRLFGIYFLERNYGVLVTAQAFVITCCLAQVASSVYTCYTGVHGGCFIKGGCDDDSGAFVMMAGVVDGGGFHHDNGSFYSTVVLPSLLVNFFLITFMGHDE